MQTAENAEQRFWSSLDLSGKVVYDVGAFHGLLTLFFASRAQTVISFEPNTQNHQRLMQNLALNGVKNVQVRNVGAGRRRETLKMVSNPLMPGGASVEESTVTGLLRASGTAVEEISIVALDEEIQDAHLPAPDFIKIDIEGWEIEALRGLDRTLTAYRPALFLEMHGETLREKKRKVAEIVAFLWDHGYHRIVHIETGSVITPEHTLVAVEGHLYCLPG
jgi:FkbM family methyltransferase